MNVLYVLKRYPRLSETFIVREIVELEQQGVTVGIEALLPPEDGPRHPMVDRVRAKVRYLPRRPRLRHAPALAAHATVMLRRPAAWIREARRARRDDTWRRFVQAGIVARRVRRDGVSVIHAHFATAAAEVAGHAAALAGVPFTVTAHAKDIYARENAGLLTRRVAAASTVVTVTDHNRRHLRVELPNTRVALVRNGVPAGTAYGPSIEGPILAVARLVEKKGLDVLIDAMAMVRLVHGAARLEIIGDGPLRDDLERHAVELGLADHVRFRGAQPSTVVEAAYGAAAMVVLPCRVASDGDRDGLPTVLVEAMSHAVPVISTDVVGIGELINDGITGMLVAADDPADLARAIVTLIDDPARADALGRAGRRQVMAEFDPAASARDLAAVFAGAAR
jgi:glycosyltransferase involved in cell wall biosynthesis